MLFQEYIQCLNLFGKSLNLTPMPRSFLSIYRSLFLASMIVFITICTYIIPTQRYSRDEYCERRKKKRIYTPIEFALCTRCSPYVGFKSRISSWHETAAPGAVRVLSLPGAQEIENFRQSLSRSTMYNKNSLSKNNGRKSPRKHRNKVLYKKKNLFSRAFVLFYFI